MCSIQPSLHRGQYSPRVGNQLGFWFPFLYRRDEVTLFSRCREEYTTLQDERKGLYFQLSRNRDNQSWDIHNTSILRRQLICLLPDYVDLVIMYRPTRYIHTYILILTYLSYKDFIFLYKPTCPTQTYLSLHKPTCHIKTYSLFINLQS